MAPFMAPYHGVSGASFGSVAPSQDAYRNSQKPPHLAGRRAHRLRQPVSPRPREVPLFIFRYVSPTDGTRRKLSIGPVTRMPLPEARNEAARCRLLLAKGVDPKAARDALAQREEPEPQPEVVTFGEFWRPALHEYAKIRRIEQKTVDTYEGQLENHLIFLKEPLHRGPF